MDRIESIFGKTLTEISLQDLKNFFQIEREECSQIEFKSGEIKIDDIYKEICAFLNTDGGTLIIGSPREKKIQIGPKSQKRVCVGELIPSNFQNKGWLTQKIASNISPFPTEIKIQEILTKDGNYFILDIPQSLIPPHQCTNEGRYYIRLEDESKPAPHGIVQALFYRRERAKVTASVQLLKYKHNEDNEIDIVVTVTNETDVPAENISILINLVNIENLKDNDSGNDMSRRFRKEQDGLFVLQYSDNQILIKELSMTFKFTIKHKHVPFIIYVLTWGKEFKLFESRCLWEPDSLEKILYSKTGENEHIKYGDLKDKLDDILKNKNAI